MNKIKKKRHHYVWRSYLRNWSVNDCIKTYFIKSETWASPNLMRVGLQKHFHRIKRFTNKEYEFCKSLFNLLPITKSSSSMELLEMFSGINNPDIQTIDKNKRKEYRDFVDVGEHNLLEEYFTLIENRGIPYLDLIEACNIDFLNEFERRSDFLYFLVVQYFRTKNMRDRLKSLMSNLVENIDEDIDLDKICILFSLQLADQVATAMAVDNDFKFFFLINKSTTTFITTDQPVINVMAKPNTVNELPKELELLYPLGPNKALIVKKSKGNSNIEIDIGEAMVKFYNIELVKHAKDQIYIDDMNHEIVENMAKGQVSV
jgi:hypothetical protein